MKVTIADKAGACYGVNRSLEIVKSVAQKSRHVATLGDLIHNPLVLKELNSNYGVITVSSVQQAANLAITDLILRSHGVCVSDIEIAKDLGINVHDATCPHVKIVQNKAYDLAQKYGCVLIIGRAGHPEVLSVSSYVECAHAKCYVAQTLNQISPFIECFKKYSKPIGVVSQTTQSQKTYSEIIQYLESNNINFVAKNTICAATQMRQDAALKLSKIVDAFVVVGGKNSSNTTHLANLCSQNCKKTFHIETLQDLSSENFSNCKHIGLSAGASTPHIQLMKTYDYLKNLDSC